VSEKKVTRKAVDYGSERMVCLYLICTKLLLQHWFIVSWESCLYEKQNATKAMQTIIQKSRTV